MKTIMILLAMLACLTSCSDDLSDFSTYDPEPVSENKGLVSNSNLTVSVYNGENDSDQIEGGDIRGNSLLEVSGSEETLDDSIVKDVPSNILELLGIDSEGNENNGGLVPGFVDPDDANANSAPIHLEDGTGTEIPPFPFDDKK